VADECGLGDSDSNSKCVINHRSITDWIIVVVLAVPAACRVTETRSDQPASPAEPSRISADGSKAADKILAETNDLRVADKWYMDVYPALQGKYGKPVSRALYDLWRESYFRDSVMPVAIQYGYNTDDFHRAFIKATARQP
jgi:hypothetical protein